MVAELKRLAESRFRRVYVEAEIGGWRKYPSGHAYFTLKEGDVQIAAVMFKSSLERCRSAAMLKDGAKVVVYANATVYPQRGTCQLVVLAAKPVGEGELMRQFLELKARLGAEGLFDASRKRPLPFLPRRIGIVTSPAGAVIHDMCSVLVRRFPAIEIRLFPASVQGDGAAETLLAGLEYFAAQLGMRDGWRADMVIIGRGGGSFEDLFCFNDERLVRALAAFPVPTVSAVGHETDFTLCDFAADVRAGTPSMAAEMAVPELSELRRRISACRSSMASSLRGIYTAGAQRIDRLGDAMATALKMRAADVCADLRELCAKLALLSPYSVLDRGYTITLGKDGKALRSAADVAPGDGIETRFRDGSVFSTARQNAG